jgi:hypothetical protein
VLRLLLRALFVFLLALSLLPAAHLPAEAPAATIFSGTVTAFCPESLTVARRILGYPVVTRTFRLTDETRVEGRLRSGARVTVRYRAVENGAFDALRIIVR